MSVLVLRARLCSELGMTWAETSALTFREAWALDRHLADLNRARGVSARAQQRVG